MAERSGYNFDPFAPASPASAPAQSSYSFDPFAEEERLTWGETAQDLGKSIWDALVYHTPAAVAAAIEGDQPFADNNWLDALVERGRTRLEEQTGTTDRKTAIPGVYESDIDVLGPSLGFTATAAAGGLLTGGAAFAAGGGPVGGTIAGGTASGVAAYRMATNQFIRDLYDMANEQSIADTGDTLTKEAFQAKQEQLSEDIRAYGLWEAGPEAAGNVIGFGILKAPIKASIHKIFGANVLTRMATKLGGLYATELPTETVTQMGQQRTEAAVGMTDEAPREWLNRGDWADSFQEIAAPVLLQTTLMGAAGGAVVRATDKKPPKEDAPKTPLQIIETANARVATARAAVDSAVNAGTTQEALAPLEAEYQAALGDIDPIAAADIEIERAGVEARRRGGDDLEVEIAKADAASRLLPKSTLAANEIDFDAADAVDTLINPAEERRTALRKSITELRAQGNENDAVRLQTAERHSAQADQHRDNGDTENEAVYRSRAAAIINDVVAKNEGLALSGVDAPATLPDNDNSIEYEVEEEVAEEEAAPEVEPRQTPIQEAATKLRKEGNESDAIRLESAEKIQKNAKKYEEQGNAPRAEVLNNRAQTIIDDVSSKNGETAKIFEEAEAEIAAEAAAEAESNAIEFESTESETAEETAEEDTDRQTPMQAAVTTLKGKDNETDAIRLETAQRFVDVAQKLQNEGDPDRAAKFAEKAKVIIDDVNSKNEGLNLSSENLVKAKLDTDAHEASTSPENDLPEPTDAQKEAGNYKMGHSNFQGLDVTIENPQGSERTGTNPDGTPWTNTMDSHYGYLKRTEGADGEQVDVFLKPGDNDSKWVFVVDQVNPDGTFDEHKVMLGYDKRNEAIDAYKANYSDDWKVGSVRNMTIDKFKEWLKDGDNTKPLNNLPFSGKKQDDSYGGLNEESLDQAVYSMRINIKETDKYRKHNSKEEVFRDIYAGRFLGADGRKYGTMRDQVTDEQLELMREAYKAHLAEGGAAINLPDTVPAPDEGESVTEEAETGSEEGESVSDNEETDTEEDVASTSDTQTESDEPFTSENISSYQIAGVQFDNKDGIAAVPNVQDINYRGAVTMMRPSEFLELTPDGIDQKSVDFISESIKSGKSVGTPFLDVDFSGNKPRVTGHEGRHRMAAMQRLSGDDAIPVAILSRNGEDRRKHFIADGYSLSEGLAGQGREKARVSVTGLTLDTEEAIKAEAANAEIAEEKARGYGESIMSILKGYDADKLKALFAKDSWLAKSNGIREILREQLGQVDKEFADYIISKFTDTEYLRDRANELDNILNKTPNPKWSQSVVLKALHDEAAKNDEVVAAAKVNVTSHRSLFKDVMANLIAERLVAAEAKGDTEEAESYKGLLDEAGELDEGIFGPKYFDAAYNAAIRLVEKQVKAEKLAQWDAVSSEALAEIQKEFEDIEDFNAFKKGWDHALGGGTASNVPTGGVDAKYHANLKDGYKRSFDLMKEHGNKAPSKNKKMEGTGKILRRMQDLKWDREVGLEDADVEILKAVKKMLAGVSRSEVFTILLGDNATNGANAAMEYIRKNDVLTPADYVIKAFKLPRRSSKKNLDQLADYIGTSQIYAHMSYDGVTDGWQDRIDQLSEHLQEYIKVTTKQAEDFTALETTEEVLEQYWNVFYDTENGRWKTYAEFKESWDYKTINRKFGGENEELELKEKTQTKPLRRPRFDRVTREGLTDHRGGKNITLKGLKAKFGLGDIHVGGYVTATQTQDHANYVYDSLMDMAKVLGWKPEQMGFGGRLDLAIGRLGKGKHAAHYSNEHPVSDKNGNLTGETTAVINVTNTSGDGSVAHEYWHAIDYMIANGMLTKQNGTESLTPYHAKQSPSISRLVELMKYSVRTEEQVKSRVDQFLHGGWSFRNSGRTNKLDNALMILGWMEEDVASLKKGGRPYHKEIGSQSAYYKHSLGLDGGTVKYWANNWELLARAGEAWVYDTLGEGKNTYLVSDWVADSVTTQDSGYKGTPYPQGGNREKINELYDVLVQSLEINDMGFPEVNNDAFLEYLDDVYFKSFEEAVSNVKSELPTKEELDNERAAKKEEDRIAREKRIAELDKKEAKDKKDKEAAAAESTRKLFEDAAKADAKLSDNVPEDLESLDLDDLENLFDEAEGEVTDESQEQTDDDNRDPATLLTDAILTNSEYFTKKLSWQKLFKLADAAYGGTQAAGTYTVKDAYDALELALNRHILNSDKALFGRTAKENLAGLEELIQNLPTQTKRTAEQDEYQQFSTPPTIAYLMAHIANLQETDVVMEPSAGTGNLAVSAVASNVGMLGAASYRGKIKGLILNEFSERRVALLGTLPFGVPGTIYRENAEHIQDIIPADNKPTVVLMNPPFSATAGRIKGKRTNEVGMQHVEAALQKLENGGRLVALVGKGLSSGKPSSTAFWERIKKDYTVRANIGLSGESYRKFGTVFDNQLLVIDKIGPHKGEVLTQEFKSKDALENLQSALEALSGVRNERTNPSQQFTGKSGSQETAGIGSLSGDVVPDTTSKTGTGTTGKSGRTKGNAGSSGPVGTGGSNVADGGRGTGEPSESDENNASGANPSEPSDALSGSSGQQVGDILADAAKHAGTGTAEAVTGLYELFGGKGLKSFPGGIDEETYARAKPHFEAAWKEFRAAGKSVKEFFVFLIRNFGAGIKPYAIRFVEEKQKAGDQAPTKTDIADSEYENLEVADKEGQTAELTDSVFDPYTPAITLPGAKPHPGALVESAAMASIDGPPTDYIPNLPKSVVESGALSDAQIEQVIRAGAAHSTLLPDGKRRGYFIGDGTGVGKAREVIGIIMDNQANGRKRHVWVSFNDGQLLKQAKSDWKSVTGKDAKGIINPLPTKANDKIDMDEGILFVSYGKLKSPAKELGGVTTRSRLEQIQEWMGEDFDGVVAFDESHKMGNAVAMKGERGPSKVTQTAQSGIDLQNFASQSRMLYVSATGATEVANLGYATRLGLWGEGTPFADVVSFIGKITAKGVAAMELVAQDLKALGVYGARSLSYHNVTYGSLQHQLTPEQIEMYDRITEAWRIIQNNMEAALKDVGIVDSGGKSLNGSAKSHAVSQFWGAHQRFFNQLLTSMQVPSLIEDMEKQIAAGHAPVLQLVNTEEARTKAAIARAAVEGTPMDELDVTPSQMIMGFLESSFPVNKFETYEEDGKIRSRPVTDSEGNPVKSAAAEAKRDDMLDQLSKTWRKAIPGGALDQIVNHFGVDAIAEATGRSKRLIDQPDGMPKIFSRTKKMVSADIQDFQDDKKKILVFSNAGSTGVDYHADLRVKNQRKRIHYLVQAGWNAAAAVQGFGRTHRSNQKQAPHYVLVTTNLKGHLRFISSVARRLDQLGALTKGQRETGSQGMFSAEHNLETSYSTEALSALIADLARGINIPDGISLATLEDGMGLDIRDEKTGDVSPKKTPTIPKFLNRILALPFKEQNFMFDTFFERVQEVIQYHVEQGTFDSGIENIRATSTRKVEETEVYTHPDTGAKTRYLKFEVDNPTHLTKFSEFLAIAEKRNKIAEMFFATNNRSGRTYGFIPSGTKTDNKSGRVRQQLRRFGPTGSLGVAEDDIVSYRSGENVHLQQNWTLVSNEDALPIWQEEYEAAPKVKTSEVNMIAGVILPIFDRIEGGSQTKIARTQTDEGERFIGMLIPEKNVASTLSKLGAERKFTQTPQEILDTVLKDDKTIVLANGWRLSRNRISGEFRIELNMRNDAYSWADKLVENGMIQERIGYTTRYFMPTDNIAAMEYLLKQSPVADIQSSGEDSGIMGSRVRAGSSENGITTDQVEAGVAKFLRKYPGADDINVEIFANNAEAAIAVPELDDLHAGYSASDNTLYITASRMYDQDHLAEVLRHEILVHKGLGFLGEKDREAFLNIVRNAITNDVALQRDWADIQERYWNVGELEQVEELLARIAEEEVIPDAKWYEAIAKALRNILIKLGIMKRGPVMKGDLQLAIRTFADAYKQGKRSRLREDDARIMAERQTGPSVQVTREFETQEGGIVEVSESAADVLQEIDDRLDRNKRLIACLRGAA